MKHSGPFWSWHSLLGHHAKASSDSGAIQTVLLVDSHRATRHQARRLLELAGFRVLTTSNGHDALLVLQQSRLPVQAIVIDQDLRDMSGAVLSERVRRDQPDVPVLLQSRNADIERVASGCEVLPKSFSHHALLRRVHALLRSESPVG